MNALFDTSRLTVVPSKASLHLLGIRRFSDLRRESLEELYEKVKRCTPQCNAVFLYAVVGVLHDTHWNALPRDLQLQLLAIARKVDTRLRSGMKKRKGKKK